MLLLIARMLTLPPRIVAENWILKDFMFKNPSGASDIILGNSTFYKKL